VADYELIASSATDPAVKQERAELVIDENIVDTVELRADRERALAAARATPAGSPAQHASPDWAQRRERPPRPDVKERISHPDGET
jgi:hypothetical protein